MLVTGKKILDKANHNNYAVAAFNVYNLETFKAVLNAAEQTKKPIIIQTSESAIKYAGAPYLKSLAYQAQKIRIDFALHLDHGKDINIIKECIKLGWTSIMFDGSALKFADNVKKTKIVVSLAKPKKISVEAELGALGGREDDISAKESLFTDPAQALSFCRQTGIDSLAVSVGTAHGPFKFTGECKLDIKRIKDIKSLTKKPLVLHGASGIDPDVISILHQHCQAMHDCIRLSGAKGVSNSEIKKAIKAGINKINIDSDLRIAFTAATRKSLIEDTQAFDPRGFLKEAIMLMEKVAIKKIKLFSGK